MQTSIKVRTSITVQTNITVQKSTVALTNTAVLTSTGRVAPTNLTVVQTRTKALINTVSQKNINLPVTRMLLRKKSTRIHQKKTLSELNIKLKKTLVIVVVLRKNIVPLARTSQKIGVALPRTSRVVIVVRKNIRRRVIISRIVAIRAILRRLMIKATKSPSTDQVPPPIRAVNQAAVRMKKYQRKKFKYKSVKNTIVMTESTADQVNKMKNVKPLFLSINF